MDYIPMTGSKGTFTVDAAFSPYINAKEIYTVLGNRLLLEMMALDPYKLIYEPAGLTEADFKADLQGDVPIIVLMNAGGKKIYVPLDRITQGPLVEGIIYQERSLTINLGALPITENIDDVVADIEQLIYDRLGLDVSSKVAATSVKSDVTYSDHDTIKTVRDNRVSVTKSYKTRLLEAEQVLAEKDVIIEKMNNHLIYLKNNP